MARNRVTYQSEALFVSSSTGAANDVSFSQLDRIQSANYSFSIGRTDVNQFGQVGRIDSLITEAPSVSLDFSYLLTDGANEKTLGFDTNPQGGGLNTVDADTDLDQFTKGIFEGANNTHGVNYYIKTVADGEDAHDGTASPDGSVISIGNAVITEYSFEASVGAFPTASLSAEGNNIQVTAETGDVAHPGLDSNGGSIPGNIGNTSTFNSQQKGNISALRSSDMVVLFPSKSATTKLSASWNSVDSEISISGDLTGLAAGQIELIFASNVTPLPAGDSLYEILPITTAVGDSAAIAANIAVQISAVSSGVADGVSASVHPTNPNKVVVDLSGASAVVHSIGVTTTTMLLPSPTTASDPDRVIDTSGTLSGQPAGVSAGSSAASVLATVPSPNDVGATDEGYLGLATASGNYDAAMHIQSFNFSLPLGRSPLQKVGAWSNYARPIDLPANATFSISAIVNELNEGQLKDALCNQSHDIVVVMREPGCPGDTILSAGALVWVFKDAALESESMSSSIGDNKTVDLTYNVGVHGNDVQDKGIFLATA